MSISPDQFAQRVASLTSLEDQENALSRAFDENRLDCIRAFINMPDKYHTENHDLALNMSMSKGNIPIALEILGLRDCSLYEMGMVLIRAAAESNLDIVHAVLNSGDISDEHRGVAVVNASRQGQLDIIQAILACGDITQKHRGLAVGEAADYGYIEIVNACLANGPISEEDRAWALMNAVENGHLEIIQAFLENGPITEKSRGDAVINAVENGHLEIIQAFLENGSISEEARGVAVINATEHGLVNIVKILLNTGNISDDHRSSAFINAVNWGMFNIVQALLDSGKIPNEDQNIAIINASSKGYLNIIQLLFKNGSISDEAFDCIAIRAAEKDRINILKVLMENDAILEENIVQFIKSRLDKCSMAIIHVGPRLMAKLRADHRFIEKLKRQISADLQKCAQKNLVKHIANFLLQHGRLMLSLPEEDPLIQQAIAILSMLDPNAENNPKNPYNLYTKLQRLVKAPISIQLPVEHLKITMGDNTIKSFDARINAAGFQKIAKAFIKQAIRFKDLPKEVKQDTLITLFDRMEARINQLKFAQKETALRYIQDCGLLNFAGHIANLKNDIYLTSLLAYNTSPDEVVPQDVAKFFMIMKNILAKSAELVEGNLLSEQEEVLIAFSASCQHCSGGKKEGIELAYNCLDESYKLSKALAFPVLYDIIQDDLSNLLSSDSDIMRELTDVKAPGIIQQLSHQSIYVKNLIGERIGLQGSFTFDFHTMTLYDALINKSSEDVLNIFYKYFTCDRLCDKVAKSISQKLQAFDEKAANQLYNKIIGCLETDENIQSLIILDASTYKPLAITKEAALILLQKSGYLH